jgi:hypothetical protein
MVEHTGLTFGRDQSLVRVFPSEVKSPLAKRSSNGLPMKFAKVRHSPNNATQPFENGWISSEERARVAWFFDFRFIASLRWKRLGHDDAES